MTKGLMRAFLLIVATTEWLSEGAMAASSLPLDLAPGQAFTLSRELVAKATDTYKFSLDGKAEISFVFSELGWPACMMEILQLPIGYPLYRFDPHSEKTFELGLAGEYRLVIYQTMSAVRQKDKCSYEITVTSKSR